MARYTATLTAPRPVEELFDYLADFTSNAEWDPATVSVECLKGPVGLGAEYRLVSTFMGRHPVLTYQTVEYERPLAVTFRAENSTVVSLDRMTFTPVDGGTRVTYDAQLTPKRWMKLAAPLLALAFKRIGDDALAGLRRAISA